MAEFTGDSVVKVTDLVAGYLPGVNILNGCSIEARRGELIGIIGPNGAGKTTLLRALVDAIPPTERFGTLETD